MISFLFCYGTGFSLHSIRRMGTRLSYIYGSREVAVSSNGHMDQNVVDIYFSAEDRQSMMGLHNKTDFVSEVGTVPRAGVTAWPFFLSCCSVVCINSPCNESKDRTGGAPAAEHGDACPRPVFFFYIFFIYDVVCASSTPPSCSLQQ